ncbi:MAG: PD40 domain-containing protein [Prolixibacteraceae bacterium]|nr:PD40 domain-containing protein [Prolixibacteraceae bacterium]
MKYIFFFIITLGALFFFAHCTGEQYNPSKVQLYAPGTINTHMAERDAALSPDGQQFYFTVQLTRQHAALCVATKMKEKMMRPKVVSFSGIYMDLEPAFHPDGRLFFASNRPLPGETTPGDFNLWYVTPQDEGWGTPIPLDTTINTEGHEFYPSFTNNGNLYFTATLPGGRGGEDLWLSKYAAGAYGKPVNLGDSINTMHDEYNAFVSPDGSYILFTSHGWGEGFGSGDLYVSFRDAEGHWKKPVNLGPKVNTSNFEFCPSLSPDGKTLFFTRRNQPEAENGRWSYFEMLSSFSSIENGQGNIYSIGTDFIYDLNQ